VGIPANKLILGIPFMVGNGTTCHQKTMDCTSLPKQQMILFLLENSRRNAVWKIQKLYDNQAKAYLWNAEDRCLSLMKHQKKLKANLL
jgi:hypothetical protein